MLFWIPAALLLPVLIAGLSLLWIWVFHLSSAITTCETITSLGTGATPQFSLNELGACEECEFPALDGVMLRGTYVHRRTSPRKGVVVFCHEFGGDRHAAASYVEQLLDQGFDIFAFDFRNHGTSDRMEGYTPRSWATRYEVDDVLGAINHVRTLDGADVAGVALMGLSRGGSAAFSAASRQNGIWAIITDGAFESRWVTTSHIRRFMPQFVRLAPLLAAAPWFVHAVYGTFVHDLVARKVKHPCIKLKNDIRHVRQPVLMIHGERDRTIPVELAHRLRRKLRTRSRLWIVSKGGHNRSIRSDPAEYQSRVCNFLRRHAPRSAAADSHEASPEALVALSATRGFAPQLQETR
ncbi:MAG: alpha/beta hydrolase [Planctomycetia bacterium]|nr:alpha/beta hydrolase [Planctomycetia bacterium]